MIKPEQIPYEVKLRLRNVLSDGETDEAEAIAAALNAWPGMEYDPGALVTDAYRDPGKIILPLPQKETSA